MKVEIKHRLTGDIIISGDYDNIKEALEKNRGADLRGADLRGAKDYSQSHDVFQEAVRREAVSVFTETEWSAIAQITIHRLCWDTIKKRFSGVMTHIFEILAKSGFPEWLEYWNKL